MPTDGLSLVGFLNDETGAINHLRTVCLPTPSKSDIDLRQDWVDAIKRLGPPFPKAGDPEVRPIDIGEPHIQSLIAAWGQAAMQYLSQQGYFAWVEIAPLLAFRHTVDRERSNFHCGALSGPPTQQELFATCLPLALTNDAVHASQQGQSFVLKSRSLNLNLVAEGNIGPNSVGVAFAFSLPWVHVVKLNGKYILHNGYHRTYGAALAGATHVPCLVREVLDETTAGINIGTLPATTLFSSNAPTLGHFIEGRALTVLLRGVSRIITVSWSQHTMFDE